MNVLVDDEVLVDDFVSLDELERLRNRNLELWRLYSVRGRELALLKRSYVRLCDENVSLRREIDKLRNRSFWERLFG